MPEAYFELCANHHIHLNVPRLYTDTSLAHLISSPCPKEKETYQILRALNLLGFLCMTQGKKEFSKIKITKFRKNLQPRALCLIMFDLK